MSEQEFWVPRLTKKQRLIFDDKHRTLLVSGPRYSAKTWGVLQRIVRHAWDTPDARIGVFVKTLKSGKIGVWDLLVKFITQEWVDNCAGFEVTVPLKTDGATRMEYFRIRNRWGGESEFQLHSLKVDEEVEEKMKGTVFSCLFFSELTNFESPDVYRLSVGSLRCPNLRYEDHLWIADTNPSDDQGTEHWVYKLCGDQRLQSNFAGMSDEEIADHKQWQQSVGVIECAVADNIYLDPRIFSDLRATFRNNPDSYAAYVEGKWVETSRDSLFDGVFSHQRHIVGDNSSKDEGEWEVPMPDDSTSTLYTGFDLGDANHGFMIAEKRLDALGRSHFHFLDEIVVIGGQVSLEEIAEEALLLMQDWEDVCGKKFQWIHWSDASAFDRYRAGANTWDHLIVAKATKGLIRMNPCPKFKSSVRMRCQLMRTLLQENRITFSVRCEKLIKSIRGGIKKSTKAGEYIKNNQHRHPFDAATYLLLAECFHELDDPELPPDAMQRAARTVSIS